jgi:hypothetical protein
MKSARAYDLIAVRGAYLMEKMPISTTHLAIRPVASRLQKMSDKGKELTMVMGCSWK